MYEVEILQRKMQPWDGKNELNKERIKKRFGKFFWRNLHQRLKKYFKEQLVSKIKQLNQRYVPTQMFLPIIQRECDTFCCSRTDTSKILAPPWLWTSSFKQTPLILSGFPLTSFHLAKGNLVPRAILKN